MAVVRGRYSARTRDKKSGWVYLLLSIVLVFTMIKWGIPVMVNLLASTGSNKNTSQIELDTIPPQTPVLSALPEATNSAQLVVDGYTEGDIEVSFWVNEQMKTTAKTDSEGLFSQEIELTDGSNAIRVKAVDQGGNESWSETVSVVYDRKPVEITITSPADASEYFGKNSKTVEIIGKVNKPDATVTINGSYAFVDTKGEFVSKYLLSDGDNKVTIRAVDVAGNQTEKVLALRYIP